MKRKKLKDILLEKEVLCLKCGLMNCCCDLHEETRKIEREGN